MKTSTPTPDTHQPVSQLPAPHDEAVPTAKLVRFNTAKNDPEALAHGVAESGIESYEPAVAEVVKAARKEGMSNVLLDVLDDRGASSVVRERALGRVLTDLSMQRTVGGRLVA